MASANVDLVRRAFDAYSALDADGVVAVMAADVELAPVASLLDGRSYVGHQGVRAFMAEMESDWLHMRIEVRECRERGDRVVMLGQVHGQGRASRVEVDLPAAWVCDLRDGKIARMQAYTDPAAALAAAGLTD
jgi:ketosteroid isomerase-like protein